MLLTMEAGRVNADLTSITSPPNPILWSHPPDQWQSPAVVSPLSLPPPPEDHIGPSPPTLFPLPTHCLTQSPALAGILQGTVSNFSQGSRQSNFRSPSLSLLNPIPQSQPQFCSRLLWLILIVCPPTEGTKQILVILFPPSWGHFLSISSQYLEIHFTQNCQ